MWGSNRFSTTYRVSFVRADSNDVRLQFSLVENRLAPCFCDICPCVSFSTTTSSTGGSCLENIGDYVRPPRPQDDVFHESEYMHLTILFVHGTHHILTILRLQHGSLPLLISWLHLLSYTCPTRPPHNSAAILHPPLPR